MGKMIPLTKVANVEDFEHSDFKNIYKKYGLSNIKPDVPINLPLLNRKTWEVAMAILAFDRLGLLDGNKEFLGIGAAKEETIVILSNHARRVFATDIYLDPGSWGDWYSSDILIDARKHFDDRLNYRKVVFQHVDGTDLPYEDNSFDGIFSCSSIEHFGDESQIRRAIEEAYRVLKPGGVAAISTEYKIDGEGEGFHNVQLFDKKRLEKVWLNGLNWKAIDFIDENLCKSEPVDFERSIHDKEYASKAFPHMILDNGKYKWTSVHLTLVKDSDD